MGTILGFKNSGRLRDKWIKVDDNTPSREFVLTINSNNQMLIGDMEREGLARPMQCTTYGQIMKNVVAYIPLEDIVDSWLERKAEDNHKSTKEGLNG